MSRIANHIVTISTDEYDQFQRDQQVADRSERLYTALDETFGVVTYGKPDIKSSLDHKLRLSVCRVKPETKRSQSVATILMAMH
jgi:hypothetical protein